MLPLAFLTRAPTLATMPAALAMALLTTELRLAGAFERHLPAFLPAFVHAHAQAILDALLVLELAFIAFRLALLVVEFAAVDTLTTAAASVEAVLTGTSARAPPALAVAAAITAVAATLVASVRPTTLRGCDRTLRSKMAQANGFPEHRAAIAYS